MKRHHWIWGTAYVLLIFGCGAAALEHSDASDQWRPPVSEDSAAMVQVEGLWGKIDDSIVEETFQRYINAFLECYEYNALEQLEEIEGDIGLYLIVAADGAVTDDIFVERGNLGSDATSQCVIDRTRRIRFQKPIGGSRARVRYSFSLEAPYNHPKPLDWSGERVERLVETHREDVERCLQGDTGVSVTLYVGRKGRVVDAGGTAESVEAYGAARCLSQLVRGWIFDDPGRRPAKATMHF